VTYVGFIILAHIPLKVCSSDVSVLQTDLSSMCWRFPETVGNCTLGKCVLLFNATEHRVNLIDDRNRFQLWSRYRNPVSHTHTVLAFSNGRSTSKMLLYLCWLAN